MVRRDALRMRAGGKEKARREAGLSAFKLLGTSATIPRYPPATDAIEDRRAEVKPMGIGGGFYIRNLVAQEMRERIALAWLNGETLSIPKQADEIARLYPGSALPNEDLRNRLFAEATRIGLPVELTRDTVKPH